MRLISGYGHCLDGVLHTQHLHTVKTTDIFRTEITIFVQSVLYFSINLALFKLCN